MGILDRYVVRSLVINYLIALGVMLSLYIVLDLSFNMDEFTEGGESAWMVAGYMARFYGCQLFAYFAQLSGVITLVACVATVVRLRRANELTAIMASGVSLYRFAVPVFAFGLATTALWVVDTELIIPRLAPQLAREHDEVRGRQPYGVWFLRDHGDALLSAQEFDPATRKLHRLLVLDRDERGKVEAVVSADEAEWEEIPGHPDGGHWVLQRGLEEVRTVKRSGLGPQEHIRRANRRIYESSLDPDQIEARQSDQWLDYLSSRRLAYLATQELPTAVATSVQQARHLRFTTPLINLLLLVLGVPWLLHRDPSTILTDILGCLGVCGLCFMVTFFSQSVVSIGSMPALSAWLPILLFAPVGVVLMDRVQT